MANRTALFSRRQPGGVFTIQDQKEHPANIWFVDSNAAGKGDTPGHGQNPDSPFATFAYAESSALMAAGDVIYLQPGHAETIAAAGGITASIAGVTVQGLGVGANKPTLTFSDPASSVLITGASTKIRGVRIVPSVDGPTNPFHVQAADCELEFEVLETNDAIEFVRAILTTAAGDRLKANIKYMGRTGGDACVNAVRLVGCDSAEINIDFYGKASTAVVEFLTTACANIKVNGRIYNSGTTNGSKNVVDTQGASTWDAVIWDAAAGLQFTGSSGKALAAADLKAVLDALYGTAGIATFPNAAIPADAVSLAEVIRQLYAALEGTAAGQNGVATWPAAAAPGNNVSIAEALRDLWDGVRNGTGGSEPGANKSLVDAIGADGAAILAVGAGSVVGASGAQFIVKKTLTSSAVLQAGVDVTGLATGGDILIEDVIFQSDGTGLVTGTNFELKKNGGKGVLTVFSESIAAIGGANKSESLGTGSVVAGDAFVLESGQKLTANSTVADCTGAGTLDIYLICRRVAAGATLAAAA